MQQLAPPKIEFYILERLLDDARRRASENRSVSLATHNPDRCADIGDRQARAHRNRYRRPLGIVVSSLLKFALAVL
jgi:hypothetical protein